MTPYDDLSRDQLIARLLALEGRLSASAPSGPVPDSEWQEEDSCFRQLAESVSEALWIRDIGEDRFLYLSPAIETIFGIRVATMYEQPGDWLSIVHLDDREEVAAAFAKQRSDARSLQLEFRIHRRPDDLRWIQLRSFPVGGAGGSGRMAGVVRDVTARQVSEQEYRTIIQASMDGFWAVGPDGWLLDCNEAACAMLGYTREEMLTLSIPDIELLEDPAANAEHIKLVIAKGMDRFVTRHRCKYGRIIDVEVSAYHLPDTDGGRLFVFLRDITAVREAQEALQESESHYRNLFETMAQGVVYHDARGAVVSANRAAAEILGLTPEQLVGRSPLDPRWRAIHPDGTPFPGDAHPALAVLHGGEPVTGVEMGVYLPDLDRYRWILIDAMPEFRPGEATPFRVYATFTDITERRLMEQALRDGQEHLRLALQAGQAGVWDWDVSSDTLEWSEEMYRLYGYDPAQGTVRLKDWAARLHPDDLAQSNALISRLFGGQIEEYRHEFRVRPAPGKERWILAIGRLQRAADGTPQRLHGINLDISERKNAEEALRASEERYRAVVEDQTEVICRFRSDGTLVFVNEIYCRFFGKDAQAILGTRWHPVAHPDDGALIQAKLAELSSDNPVVVIENRVYAGDGRLHWMQFVNRAFYGESGRLDEIQAVGRDITERKRAEQAAQEAQIFRQAILDAVSSQVAVLDQRGTIIEVNESWRRFGLDNGRGSGQVPQGDDVGADYLWYCQFPEGDGSAGAREAARGIQAVLDRRVPVYTQEYPCHAPHARRWFMMNVTPLNREEGGVVISHNDITSPRLLAEELRQSEARTRSILRAAPVGIGVLIDRVLQEVNHAMTVMTGYTVDELIGRSARMLYPTDEDFDYVGREKYGQLHDRGLGQVQTRWRCKDGRIIDVALCSAPVVSGDLGQGVTFAAQDITAMKQAEQERLAHESSQRDALVREVHHRIKNNLQGVINLMRQHIAAHPETRASIEAAIGQVQTISVVHGLQSRLGQDELRLCEILQEVSAAAGSLAMVSSPPVINDCRDSDIWLDKSAAVSVALILNELIHNALKHGRAGHKVKISLTGGGGRGRVKISNSSRPLAPGFDLTDGAGCGTGLNLVRTLMPRRGASLDISHTEGWVTTDLSLAPPVTLAQTGNLKEETT